MLFKATLRVFCKDRARGPVSTKWDQCATAIRTNALFKISASLTPIAPRSRLPNRLTFTTLSDFRLESGKTFKPPLKTIRRLSNAIQLTLRPTSIAGSLTTGLAKSTKLFQTTPKLYKSTPTVPTVTTIEASVMIKKDSPKRQSKILQRPSRSTRRKLISLATELLLTVS